MNRASQTGGGGKIRHVFFRFFHFRVKYVNARIKRTFFYVSNHPERTCFGTKRKKSPMWGHTANKENPFLGKK